MSAVPPRRLVGLATAAVVAVVAVAHTALRDHRWAYEWRWAFFQYQLVVLLLAPVVAAAAAAEAVALRPAVEPVAAAGRTAAWVVRALCRQARWVVLGWSAGLVLPVAVVWQARGIEVPPAEAVVIVAGGLAQLGAVLAVGFGLGWAWPRPAAVPVAGVAAFAGLLALAVFAPDPLGRTGGASGSLLGLHLPAWITVGQLVAYGAVAALVPAICWAADRLLAAPTRRWGPVVVLVVVASGAVAVLARPHQPEYFVARPEAVACRGHRPRWCVARPYLPAVRRLGARLAPVLAEVRQVGVEPPSDFELGTGTGRAVDDLLVPDPRVVPFAVAYAWLPPGCTRPDGGPLLDDLSAWTFYLADVHDGIRRPAVGAEVDRLRAAARRIRRCGR